MEAISSSAWMTVPPLPGNRAFRWCKMDDAGVMG